MDRCSREGQIFGAVALVQQTNTRVDPAVGQLAHGAEESRAPGNKGQDDFDPPHFTLHG